MISALLLIILLCMIGSGFFSGIETGVISIHRMRLRHFVRHGSRNALILQEFVESFDRLLGTTLVGTNICVVVISVVSASLAVRLLGEWGEALSTAVTAILILIFCEYMPKAWFHARPLERCERFAGVLRVMEVIFKPISFAVLGVTGLILRNGNDAFAKPDPFVTREDLKILAREGEKDGVLSPRERVMIHRVIELSGKRADRVMVPREEMVCVDKGTAIPAFLEKARESKFTRMPIYNSRDNMFCGIINVFFVLSAGREKKGGTVERFARAPLFVPGNMPVDDILPRMRRARQPMCLVVDDNENVIGLITTEDILESIVGEL